MSGLQETPPCIFLQGSSKRREHALILFVVMCLVVEPHHLALPTSLQATDIVSAALGPAAVVCMQQQLAWLHGCVVQFDAQHVALAKCIAKQVISCAISSSSYTFTILSPPPFPQLFIYRFQ
jgi:hypothetical protein